MSFHTFIADEQGATAIEYSLIASLLALAIVGAATLIGQSLASTFTTVDTHLSAN